MDEIQDRLEQFERDHTPPTWLRDLRDRAPLLGPVLGLILGIALQHALKCPLVYWMVLTLLVLGIAGAMLKNRPDSVHIWALLAIAVMTILGAVRLNQYSRPDPSNIAHLVQAEPRLVTLRGQVRSAPRVRNSDPNDDRARSRTQFTFRCQAVRTTTGWQPCTGLVAVSIYEAVSLQVADHLRLSGWLRPWADPTNPGQFNWAEYNKRRNIRGSVLIKSSLALKVLSHASGFSLQVLHQRLINAVQSLYALGYPPDRDNGIAEALLLGRRDHLSRPLLIAFRKTGLLHLISLSGLHVGILASLAWGLGWFFRRLKPGRAILTAVQVALFILVVPPRAATLRAAIICWIFCLGQILRRHHHPLNLLSLAAMVLLILRPTQLFDVGWQLSFACVLSIILWLGHLRFYPQRWIDRWIPAAGPRPLRPIRWLLQTLVTLLCLGGSAWLGGAGLLVFHFHTLTPLSPVWTLLALPWVYFIFIVGLIKILAAACFLSLCHVLAGPLLWAEHVLARIIEGLAWHGAGTWVIGKTPGLLIWIYYATLLAWLWPWVRRCRPRRLAVVFVWIGVIGVLMGLTYQHRHPSEVRITCLDVGHGQAVVLQHPNGHTLLFDAGSLNDPGIGEDVINPFLNVSGINHLDAAVISHTDIDHLNGLTDVLTQVPTRVIYTPAPFVKRLPPYFSDCPRACLPPIKAVPPELNIGPHLAATMLWPQPHELPISQQSDNNLSIVIRLAIKDHSFLICSDIEQPAQERLLTLYPGLHSQIVLAPHHGSAKTLDPDFISSLQPEVVLISSDKPGTIAWGVCKVYCTSERGTIRLTLPTQGKPTFTFGIQKPGGCDLTYPPGRGDSPSLYQTAH